MSSAICIYEDGKEFRFLAETCNSATSVIARLLQAREQRDVGEYPLMTAISSLASNGYPRQRSDEEHEFLCYSFTDWNGLNPNYRFIGLANFIEALTKDKYYLESIGFTFKYVVAMVTLSNGIALGLALLIDARIKSQNLFRTLFFIPNMISFIIGAYIWQFIFKKVLKEMSRLPFLDFLNQPWLGNPTYSFWAIVMMSLWTSVGYLLVIYIAALQGVPAEIREAAQIDGARGFQMFRNVTLPMIMHAVTINLFLILNNSFKAFDQIYGLTGGGPGRTTQVMSLNIYAEAFSSNFRFGYANAKAIILFLFVLVVTLIQLKVTRGKEVHA